MRQYLSLLEEVLETGTERRDRTGTGTRALFGRQIRFDLADGFPMLTTKRLPLRVIAVELLWFLRGGTNVRWLQERGVKIWNEWADENGNLGPVYGAQWRRWPDGNGGAIDQVDEALQMIRNDPHSRRIIINAWNVAEIPQMKLPPCHMMLQLHVSGGRLSGQLYQRSADLFLGVPFNIASYALLLSMMAEQTGLEPGDFVWTGGDCHLYSNHCEQAREQLSREPRPLPRLQIREGRNSIDDYVETDFELIGYDPHPHIPAPISV